MWIIINDQLCLSQPTSLHTLSSLQAYLTMLYVTLLQYIHSASGCYFTLWFVHCSQTWRTNMHSQNVCRIVWFFTD